MGNEGFRLHSDYPRLIAGAHRRRVTPMGAPALVRHLVFWKPPDQPGASEALEDPDAQAETEIAATSAQPTKEQAASMARRRALGFDQAIALVYHRLKLSARGRYPTIASIVPNSIVDGTDLILLFESAADGIGVLQPVPAGWEADSYRTIAIEFRWRHLPVTLSFELHTEFMTITSIIDISRDTDRIDLKQSKSYATARSIVTGLTDLADQATLGQLSKDRSCKPFHRQLYIDVWEEFEQALLSPLHGEGQTSIGAKIVDFRGLVLGAGKEPGSFAPPFKRAAGVGDQEMGPTRDPACSENGLAKIWPLLTCELSRGTEFTVSSILGGCAYFATALGDQSAVKTEAHRHPIYYFIYEDTFSPAQLGRLIYRLHRAGTSRIAAAMHYWRIRAVSERLARVDDLLDRQLGSRGSVWQRTGPGRTGGDGEYEINRRYFEVEKRLLRIARLDFDGPLDYRIERSRYYANQFERVAKSLRVDRVGGYQPYIEFVHQRFGPVFDDIDRIGTRYARVQQKRSLLYRRMQISETIRQENAIGESTKAIEKFQDLADIALSCVLGPYYLAYILANALGGWIDPQALWISALVFGISMGMAISLRLPFRIRYLYATAIATIALGAASYMAAIAPRTPAAAVESPPTVQVPH